MSLWNRLKNSRIVILITETITRFGEDKGGLLAAAVAYYLLFSIFPFALAMIFTAGFFIEAPGFETRVINAMGNLLPVAREMLANNLQEVVNARAETGILAMLVFIWSASSFFYALRNTLNKAWGINKDASFFKGKIIDIAMLLASFLLLMGYIWLSAGIRIIHSAHYYSDYFKFLNSTTASATIFTAASGLLAFLIIMLLYKVIPSDRPRWRDIWPGALMAAVSIEIIRFGFVWYIKHFSQYNLVYGSIGAVIALLVYIYLSAWALLFFAKLSATRLRLQKQAGES
ncbi:MAG: YihY/virulence factor BrkB family protein [Dehalococcoidia bacterium]|nr:YihY/virulence factor BrkB family protein [Dehalococcoidia bacterium]